MQQLNKNLFKSLLISFALAISACAPDIPDVPTCQNLPAHRSIDPATGHEILAASPACMKEVGEFTCGHCVNIVSQKEFYVGSKAPFLLNGKNWEQIQAESIYVPAKESYAPMIEYSINSCKKLKCNELVEKFKVKIDRILPKL